MSRPRWDPWKAEAELRSLHDDFGASTNFIDAFGSVLEGLEVGVTLSGSEKDDDAAKESHGTSPAFLKVFDSVVQELRTGQAKSTPDFDNGQEEPDASASIVEAFDGALKGIQIVVDTGGSVSESDEEESDGEPMRHDEIRDRDDEIGNESHSSRPSAPAFYTSGQRRTHAFKNKQRYVCQTGRLANLPVELLTQILSYCLVKPTAIAPVFHVSSQNTSQVSAQIKRFSEDGVEDTTEIVPCALILGYQAHKPRRWPLGLSPQVLATCKLFHRMGSYLFYGKNSFDLGEVYQNSLDPLGFTTCLSKRCRRKIQSVIIRSRVRITDAETTKPTGTAHGFSTRRMYVCQLRSAVQCDGRIWKDCLQKLTGLTTLIVKLDDLQWVNPNLRREQFRQWKKNWMVVRNGLLLSKLSENTEGRPERGNTVIQLLL